jgi:prepilin-type N-terminal cleavage/methylation domain-containing protein
MIRDHSRRGQRSAFTLVELMVVLLIIAILVSLLGSAVMKAMGKIPEVQTRTEISEMSVALQAFMSDYNLAEPPPSYLILHEHVAAYPGNAALAQTWTFLQKTFAKNLGAQSAGWIDWNGDGLVNGPWFLEGEQCLVFYLGGIPNLVGGPQGFSTNSMNPALAGGKRKGPYYTFDLTRLKPGNGGFFVYIDAWQTKTSPFYATLGGTPYAYFSSRGINNGYNWLTYPGHVHPGDCPSIRALQYFLAGTTQCMNPNTYQIISAGKDGVFGTIGWIPANGAVGAGADDQANFSSTLLGSGQN